MAELCVCVFFFSRTFWGRPISFWHGYSNQVYTTRLIGCASLIIADRPAVIDGLYAGNACAARLLSNQETT